MVHNLQKRSRCLIEEVCMIYNILTGLKHGFEEMSLKYLNYVFEKDELYSGVHDKTNPLRKTVISSVLYYFFNIFFQKLKALIKTQILQPNFQIYSYWKFAVC